MEDARSTGRWYLAITMGRKSGSLALSMCKSAGATLAVIPEEFRGNKSRPRAGRRHHRRRDNQAPRGWPRQRRRSHRGRNRRAYGHQRASGSGGVEGDPYGHIHIADIPLGAFCATACMRRSSRLGIEVTVVAKDIGYELRCAKPLAFDVEYTRTLGYGAVRYLLGGGSGALVALAGGRVTPIDFDQLLDPNTGRIRVRTVDVSPSHTRSHALT